MEELLSEMVAARVEEMARQQLLNQALFRIVEQNGGSMSLPLDVFDGKGMGGIIVEVNLKEKSLTLKTADEATAKAYAESIGREHH